jgi:lipopolysaccharide export system protein LptA
MANLHRSRPPLGRRGSVVSTMPLIYVLVLVIGITTTPMVRAQDPRPPVYLEHADSVLGSGSDASGIRRYEGNVRFRQGNVTVRCDRATEYVGGNAIDLSGRVVLRQGEMELRAPLVSYDGNTALATARGGVRVVDAGRTIQAQTGTYSPETRLARFMVDVLAQDDSVIIGADTLLFYRNTRVLQAWGRVVMSATDSTTWLTGDSALQIPNTQTFTMVGRARLWSFQRTHKERQHLEGSAATPASDTLYLEADTLQLQRQGYLRRWARGTANLRRDGLASRSDELFQDDSLQTITLLGTPILWADSTQITGDTIVIDAPDNQLRAVSAYGSAFMISVSGAGIDTTTRQESQEPTKDAAHKGNTNPDRYDQISGGYINIAFSNDSIREVLAINETKSLYFRFEDDEPQGLAQFASDSLRVSFLDGMPEDIRWLGTVRGEQHPENVVAGRSNEYKLPGFNWRTDRPLMPPLPRSHGGAWRTAALESWQSVP